MAKSAINLRQAQQLCTAQEFALVRAAQPREIGQWSAAQLGKKIERARDLRDKWKDQSVSGRRRAQETKGHRGADGASRSREKAALFAAVLKAFQMRAAEVRDTEATGGARKVAKKKVAKKSATKVGKPATPATAKKNAATKKTTKKKAVSKKTTKKSASALVAAAGKKKSAKRAGHTTKPPEQELTETHRLVLHAGLTHRGADLRPGGGADAAPFAERPLHFGGSNPDLEPGGRMIEPAVQAQLQAETAAKQRRINASGLRSRVRGQVSARGRRAQAKRDS